MDKVGSATETPRAHSRSSASGGIGTRHVPYGPLPRQKLDVHLPKSGKARAVILYLYGGGWVSGARWYYRLFGRTMAARGFGTVVPDYHLYPHAAFPRFVEDAALAFKWTHDNAARLGGDTSRLFVMGHSAGAHIATLLALDPKYLRACGLEPSAIRGVIAMAGPYTLNPFKWSVMKDIFAAAVAEPHGARPIKLVRAGAPDMLLLHGASDRVVKAETTVNFASALQEAGSKAEVRLYPRIGHFEIFGAFLWGWRWRAGVLKDTEDFIAKRVDG